MKKRKPYRYSNKRRKPKYGNIILTLLVVFLIVLAAPRVSFMFKGYSMRASNNLVFADIETEFNNNINKLLSSKNYQGDKIETYLELSRYLDEHEIVLKSSDYTGFVNILLDEKDYNLDTVKLIIATHSEDGVEMLTSEEKNIFLEELAEIDYLKLEFYDEYIEYYNTFRKAANKIVLEVNMRVNYEPFDENILVQLEKVDGYDLIVNHFSKLPDGYEPAELTRLSGPRFVADIFLESGVAEAYEELRQAAALEDYHLGAMSGYRSYDSQKRIYDKTVQDYVDEGLSKDEAIKRTREYVAVPGHSEHQTGFSVDWYLPYDDYCQGGKCLSSTDAYSWMKKHMHEYGFILRYPASKVKYTNIGFEPWHIRYVGVKVATYLYENDLTLEEWYAMDNKLD